jgi:soluble lytic murein transglycosylase-like protein
MRGLRSLFSIVLLAAILLFATAHTSHGGLTAALRKHGRKQINGESLRKLEQFEHLIEYFCSFSYFAPGHRVSPDFIKALILAESDADPRAVSKKNAVGLGQIIPATGSAAARELAAVSTTFRYVSKKRLINFKPADLFDPAVNILLTCYLIAKYNHRFDGKLDLVVSAWNAGENTISLQYGRHAPFAETEDLIGKINGYYIFLLKKPR